MNERFTIAMERCPKISPVSLEEFLNELLDRKTDQLARLPGTPATVLAAQFTYYAKTSVTLAEELRRDTRNAKKITDLVWRLSQKAGKHSKNAAQAAPVTPTQNEDADHDSRLSPREAERHACPRDS